MQPRDHLRGIEPPSWPEIRSAGPGRFPSSQFKEAPGTSCSPMFSHCSAISAILCVILPDPAFWGRSSSGESPIQQVVLPATLRGGKGLDHVRESDDLRCEDQSAPRHGLGTHGSFTGSFAANDTRTRKGMVIVAAEPTVLPTARARAPGRTHSGRDGSQSGRRRRRAPSGRSSTAPTGDSPGLAIRGGIGSASGFMTGSGFSLARTRYAAPPRRVLTDGPASPKAEIPSFRSE